MASLPVRMVFHKVWVIGYIKPIPPFGFRGLFHEVKDARSLGGVLSLGGLNLFLAVTKIQKISDIYNYLVLKVIQWYYEIVAYV